MEYRLAFCGCFCLIFIYFDILDFGCNGMSDRKIVLGVNVILMLLLWFQN